MFINSKNASVKTIFLGVVFVVVGFSCAFILFNYLTKADQNSIAAAPSSEFEVVEQPEVEVEPVAEVEIIESAPEEPEAIETTEEIVEIPAEKALQPVLEEATMEQEVPSLVLNGIFASGTGNYALINNRIVREGESILGVKVVRIYFNKVVLDAFGKEMILRVK